MSDSALILKPKCLQTSNLFSLDHQSNVIDQELLWRDPTQLANNEFQQQRIKTTKNQKRKKEKNTLMRKVLNKSSTGTRDMSVT
jgi:hypothetical protein